jgi:hypothetical protein
MERFSSTLAKALKLLDALKAFAYFEKKSKRARAFEYKNVQNIMVGSLLDTNSGLLSQ